jgi:hypothetical protein
MLLCYNKFALAYTYTLSLSFSVGCLSDDGKVVLLARSLCVRMHRLYEEAFSLHEQPQAHIQCIHAHMFTHTHRHIHTCRKFYYVVINPETKQPQWKPMESEIPMRIEMIS